jgi:hypothetical protein
MTIPKSEFESLANAWLNHHAFGDCGYCYHSSCKFCCNCPNCKTSRAILGLAEVDPRSSLSPTE